MTLLLVAPSNAGKSIYIEQIIEPGTKVWYAFELQDGDPPTEGIVHYNLLFQAPQLLQAGHLPAEWDLLAEPILARLLQSRRIEKAIVIVAPIVELLERAAARVVIEPSRAELGKYPNDLWTTVLRTVDLFALYERLFDALHLADIPVHVLYSSKRSHGRGPVFLPSDRAFVCHNLRGEYVSTPSMAEIDAVISSPGAEYQIVILPCGKSTRARGFAHVANSRSQTFESIRDRSFVGRSILDVGCALGDMLFRAERYGASRLVGVELKATRYEAACRIANLLRSKATFHLADFLAMSFSEQFDDVLLLNVLHHVSDFRAFLMKAAELAKQRVVVEYPTLKDRLFQSLFPISEDLQHLPIVGVSSAKVDQTFVFTRPALERLAGDIGHFRSQVYASPIDGREILVMTRL